MVKYNFIEKIDGVYTEPYSMYVIYPSVLHCIDGNIVRNILEEFKRKAENNNLDDISSVGGDSDEIYN